MGCLLSNFTTETIPVVPDCTVITSPIDGAMDVSITSELSWLANENAEGYYITIGTISGGSEIENNTDLGNVLSYTPSGDWAENQEYFVTVIAYSTAGNSINCSEISFNTETIPVAPGCTNLNNLVNGQVDVSVSSPLTWSAVEDADGYFITIGSFFGGNDVENETDLGNVTTYQPAMGWAGSQTYFVTLNPYNATGSALDCEVISFTTETTLELPNCTIVNNPTNGSEDVTITSGISWLPIDNADGYYISIGTSPGATDILNNADVGSTIPYVPIDPWEQDTEYFVTVIPYNSLGLAFDCAETSFSTETIIIVPECANLLSPFDGEIDVSLSAEIMWEEVNDAEGYLISIGTSSGGMDIEANTDLGNQTSYLPTVNWSEDETYFVTIIPYNEAGLSLGCIETEFTTIAIVTIPECAQLTSPFDGQTAVASNATLSWSTIDNAEGYLISITSEGELIIDNLDVGNVMTYVPSGTWISNQTYVVLISAYNSAGMATNCFETTFVTQSVLNLGLTKFGFSPDDDGINEYWEIVGIEDFPNNEVTIYNRWGDVVFKTKAYNNDTNAFRGVSNKLSGLGAGILPEGTYFFKISVDLSDTTEELEGFVVLKR